MVVVEGEGGEIRAPMEAHPMSGEGENRFCVWGARKCGGRGRRVGEECRNEGIRSSHESEETPAGSREDAGKLLQQMQSRHSTGRDKPA